MSTYDDGLWNQISGNWEQFKGHVQEKWGELTNDDLDQIQGKRDVLQGKLRERYGEAQMDYDREVDDWASSLGL